MTQLLDWVEQFEADSQQSNDAVAFSVVLGDLNFDNCSPGEGRARSGEGAGPGGGAPAHGAAASLQRTHPSKSIRFLATSETPVG